MLVEEVTRDEDGAHQDRAVRLVILPDIFVRCLPPDKRLSWYELWDKGDPTARAYKKDMSLLPANWNSAGAAVREALGDLSSLVISLQTAAS